MKKIFTLLLLLAIGYGSSATPVFQMSIDKVSSPTYSLANEYVGGGGRRIFHLDCYRIAHLNEAIDAGIEDYVHTQKALCFVEWYQVVAPLLPQSYWLATIKVLSATERSISFELITNK